MAWNDENAVRVEKTDSIVCRILADGIKSEEAFIKYIKEELNKLEAPLIITKIDSHED